jgi:hypothetical protein
MLTSPRPCVSLSGGWSSGTGYRHQQKLAGRSGDPFERQRWRREPEIHRLERIPSRFPASQIDHVPPAKKKHHVSSIGEFHSADRVIHRHDANGGCRETAGTSTSQSKCPLFAEHGSRFEQRELGAPSTPGRPVAVMMVCAHPASSPIGATR